MNLFMNNNKRDHVIIIGDGMWKEKVIVLCKKQGLTEIEIMDSNDIELQSDVYYVVAFDSYICELEEAERLSQNNLEKDKDFFLSIELSWMGLFDEKIEEDMSEKSRKTILGSENSVIRKINKLLYFTNCSHSGKFFMCSLLDGHPNILTFSPCSMAMNIKTIVQNAHKLPTNMIADYLAECAEREFMNNTYEQYMDRNREDNKWIRSFLRILKNNIDESIEYSERDIFILIHWCIYEALYGEYNSTVVPWIFLDMHAPKEKKDENMKWLMDLGFEITLLEAVRRPVSKFGSVFKMFENRVSQEDVYRNIFYLGREVYSECERMFSIIRYRFEDLKLHPKETLERLCERLEIPFDESMLKATFLGKEVGFISNEEKIKGFDLKPVYNMFEKYINSLDRLRLDILFREKNRAYGYSYVSKEFYENMIDSIAELFSCEYKFERYMLFDNEEEKERFRKCMSLLAKALLDLYDDMDNYPVIFNYGEYIRISE